jgi:hypothetical protein
LELQEEQTEYARQLIAKIEFILNNYDNKSGAVKLKEQLKRVLNNTMFER